MGIIEAVVADVAESWWIYPLVGLLAALDGFTIVVPSESVVAGLASTAVTLGQPHVVGLGAVAALGAHVSDLGVFALGRLLSRVRWFREGHPLHRSVEWTGERLEKNGPLFIMTGRYIPFARLLVNATAGWSGFPLHRFVALSAVGCILWAAFYVLVGVGIGALFGDWWWIGVLVAIGASIVLGWAIDRWVRSRAQP